MMRTETLLDGISMYRETSVLVDAPLEVVDEISKVVDDTLLQDDEQPLEVGGKISAHDESLLVVDEQQLQAGDKFQEVDDR